MNELETSEDNKGNWISGVGNGTPRELADERGGCYWPEHSVETRDQCTPNPEPSQVLILSGLRAPSRSAELGVTRLRGCLLWLSVIVSDAEAVHAAVADPSLPSPAQEVSPDAGVTDDAAASADGAPAPTGENPSDAGPASPNGAPTFAV